MRLAKKIKRAPRQVWLVVEDDGAILTTATKKSAAIADLKLSFGGRVVGPYVLAERVSER